MTSESKGLNSCGSFTLSPQLLNSDDRESPQQKESGLRV